MPLVSVPGPTARNDAPPEWLSSDHLRLWTAVLPTEGEPVYRFEDDASTSHWVTRDEAGSLVTPFDPNDAFHALSLEQWAVAVDTGGLSAGQLAAYYRVKALMPRGVQLWLRRRLIRKQGPPEFPRWPLDTTVERLLALRAAQLAAAHDGSLRFRWFWPPPFRAAAILTHDVETGDGLRLGMQLADLEEERGLRSSFNVVARDYPIDMGIVEELRARGFEIGVHGVHHDRSLFADRAAFELQQPILRDAARDLGASGFRSPATHRVPDWLRELPFDYDCTMPHSDPYEPIPGGCCSLWPYFLGDVVELPYTVPQDHTILTLLGHRDASLWTQQLKEIAERFGLAQFVTHPDAGYLAEPAKRQVYVEVLDDLSEQPDVWKALPRDVAAWWRWRDSASEGQWDGGVGSATWSDGAPFATIEPPSR